MAIQTRRLPKVAVAVTVASMAAAAAIAQPLAGDTSNEPNSAATHLAATSTDGTPTAGAPGLGDSKYPLRGNGGYDVQHYDINVEFDDVSRKLAGTTTIQAVTTQALSSFNLDFSLTVSSITVNGAQATFHTDGEHELVVTPAVPLKQGETVDVVVSYSGIPESSGGENFTAVGRTDDNGLLILGEPESAQYWFPSNDHPTDKATYRITATVPEAFSAISNGKEMMNKLERGKRTTSWSMTTPMATYLSFLAISKFEVQRGFSSSGHPATYAFPTEGVDPKIIANGKSSILKTPEIVTWAERRFGKYPFRQVGGVMPPLKTGFALENQSRPVYSTVFFEDGPYDSVVVHELAHQWFGDSIAVKDWRDIWLNEGFATWAETMHREDTGQATANERMRLFYKHFKDDEAFWQVPIGNPPADKLFDTAVYYRGSMTLQALRNRIGDKAFFELMREHVAANRGGNAQVSDFTDRAKRISGQDLDSFFKVWLYTPERPAATVENGMDPTWDQPAEARLADADQELQRDLLRDIKRTELMIRSGHGKH